MALKAGYYGIKKNIKNRLEKVLQYIPSSASADNPLATQSEINDLWNFNGETGVHNLLNATLPAPATQGGITLSESGGVFTCSNDTASGNAIWNIAHNYPLKAGTYLLSGCPTGGSTGTDKYRIDVYSDASTVLCVDGGEGAIFTLPNDGLLYNVRIRIANGIDATGLIFRPMIRAVADLNEKFTPYAMTNKELTNSVADQKTAINAIITAATEAADFAAFKTAMGAITPVTRSLQATAPDNREIADEPVVEKTTTKKTTKKTSKVEEE